MFTPTLTELVLLENIGSFRISAVFYDRALVGCELQKEEGKNLVRLRKSCSPKLQGGTPGRMPKFVRESFGWCNGHCV